MAAVGEGLALSAAQLRESLELCGGVTGEATQLLDACAERLRKLERGVAPMTERTAVLSRARDNLKQARERADEVMDHLDASRLVQGVIEEGPRANLQAFLAGLGKLEAAIAFLQQHRSMHSAADALSHASALRDRAVEKAAAEFGALLSKHSVAPPALLALQRQNTSVAMGLAGSPSLDQDLAAAVVGLLPEGVLQKLRALAGAQLSNGSRGCIKTYAEARRRVVQQCLDPLLAGVGSREEVARLPAWRQVEVRIPGWEAAVKLLARLVQEEGRLCAAVFPPPEQPLVLQQVIAKPCSEVVNAGDAILAGKRVPDKLFSLLGMHDVAGGALPALRSALAPPRLKHASLGGAIPPPQQALAAAAELAGLQSRIDAEVRACFGQLEESYGGRVAEGVPPDATVHPLCGSTTTTLKRLLSYESALPVLFGSGTGGRGGGGEPGGGGGGSALGRGGLQEEALLLEQMSSAVTAILDSLLAALEAKARGSYRSPPQAALHMLNNAQFVAHAAGGRELKAVGEPWLDAHKGLAERYRREYMEACWAPMVSLLQASLAAPAPTPADMDKGDKRQALKDAWTALNRGLEPALTQQGGWTVVDAGLRASLKEGILDQFLPLYQEFEARSMQVPFTENRPKYIRFPSAQVAAFVEHELFEGGGGGGPARSGPSMRSFSLTRHSASPQQQQQGASSGGS